MRQFIYIIVFLLLATSVAAVDTVTSHSITILAVSEYGNGTLQGGTASMTLQVKPGTGAIFIESYPLAKIDTQVATRLANEVACSFTQVNCEDYDFFYTIRADSTIIGGPSAGAATSLLTYAVLEDIPLRDDFAMTGAISSGGVITPVSGLKEKVAAAADKGYSLVLLPLLSLYPYMNLSISTIDNSTLFNLSDHDDNLYLEDFEQYNISVVPVLGLQEALEIASNHDFSKEKVPQLKPPQYFLTQMSLTAQKLCDRTETLFSEVGYQENNSLYTIAQSFYNRSLSVDSPKDSYSKASFCYSANIQLRHLLLENLSQEVLNENYDNLLQAQSSLDLQLVNKELKTFSDVETFVIVKERLLESRTYTDQINESNISSSLLAVGIERYYSAVVWSGFFDMPGEQVVVDQTKLRQACLEQMQNVESRMNYLKTFMPEKFLLDVSLELKQSYAYAANNEYALCLFKSTKARANADLFLSTLGVTSNDSVRLIVKEKLNRSAELIQREQDSGRFPLLGYSYFGYAHQLIEDDPYSALLFSEYAIGFSDLRVYFPSARQSPLQQLNWPSLVAVFITGLCLGALIMLLIIRHLLTSKQIKHSSRSRKRK